MGDGGQYGWLFIWLGGCWSKSVWKSGREKKPNIGKMSIDEILKVDMLFTIDTVNKTLILWC